MRDDIEKLIQKALEDNIDAAASSAAFDVEKAIEREVEARVRAWMNDISIWLKFHDGKMQVELHWNDFEESVFYNFDQVVSSEVHGLEAPRSYFEEVAKRFDEYAAQMRRAEHAIDE